MYEKLVEEIRREFQIPPFFPRESLVNYIKEGKAWFEYLRPGCIVDEDMVYRSLLKNYVYYAYHHKINEFRINYASLILGWQLGEEVRL